MHQQKRANLSEPTPCLSHALAPFPHLCPATLCQATLQRRGDMPLIPSAPINPPQPLRRLSPPPTCPAGVPRKKTAHC
jgi:hypothetical protein